MARDLDSEMLGRLQEQYGAMSDGELQRMAGKPEELTDLALEVLRGEMTRRRLAPLADEADRPEAAREAFGTKPVAAGWVPLMTFNDAMAARLAIQHLEGEGLEIDVRDVSDKETQGGMIYGGPAVALQVIVRGADRDRAQRILREQMGLFPLKEVEGEDAPEEGATLVLATFGQRGDAGDVGRILEEAGVWHRVEANPDGAAETEDAYSVEVREADQPRALEIVEREMGMGEG